MSKLKIAVIREGKIPQDTRTPLAPKYARELMDHFPEVEVLVESSPIRCYSDEEYRRLNITVTDDIADCDLFIGVKEVPDHLLVPGKAYMFFSHTIKKQPHNRHLLQAILSKKIRLIDYELLTDDNCVRLIGFGHYAGLVGAHYALLMWGKRNKYYEIKPAVRCRDLKDMISQYKGLYFDSPRIIITGKGRVGNGAQAVMQAAGIRFIEPAEYLLNKVYSDTVYTQIDANLIHCRKDGGLFSFDHFFTHPESYKSCFLKYTAISDILINAIYWDKRSPRLFEEADIHKKSFRIRTISDISCDINGSVPITKRASAISDPVFGYDLRNDSECLPYLQHTIDMMTVDNLPNELPRDASNAFSEVMINKILPLYIESPFDDTITRASIAEKGELIPYYAYLQEWVDGKEL
jgi:alanine dehydrogenase